MSSLIDPVPPSYAQGWHAVLLALGLHALVVMLYPMLSQISLPAIPERLEIAMFSITTRAPQATVVTVPTPVTMPPSVRQKTAPPVETVKPVLAAPVSRAAEYAVPEPTPALQSEPAPAATPVITTTSSGNTQPTSNEAPLKEAHAAPAASALVAGEPDTLSASDSDAWGEYGEQLRALVNKSKQYPAIAIRRHLEGEAMVVAQFVRGELVDVALTGSSQHRSLDEEALRMVKKAITQLGIKDSLRKKTFKITIPVAFRLE